MAAATVPVAIAGCGGPEDNDESDAEEGTGNGQDVDDEADGADDDNDDETDGTDDDTDGDVTT